METERAMGVHLTPPRESNTSTINAEAIKRFKEQLRLSWSYQDVLALAMAKASSVQFTANPEEWDKTVEQFQARLEEEQTAPELLKGVYFDRRDPERPYSDQVVHFLQAMGRARILQIVPQNGNLIYKMNEEAKKDIVFNQAPDFQTNARYRRVIGQLAEFMDNQLGR